MSHVEWGKGLISQLVAWYVRPRNLGVFLIKYSLAVLGVLAGGFTLKAQGIAGVLEAFEFSSGAGPTGYLLTVVVWFASLTLLIGIGLVLLSVYREYKEAESHKILVFEFRGLVDTSDKPLLGAIPRSIVGHRSDYLVDVRKFLAGQNPNVSEAINEISNIQREVRRARGDTSRADVQVVAGGVMQVPLLFYAGTLLDDEGKVHLFDWERTKAEWKQLNDPDDGERFQITGLEGIGEHNEVVLAVSASYLADFEDIATTFPHLPLIRMTLPTPQVNSIWSEDTQVALTQQFLQTLGTLVNQGVGMIHLILVAPSSLAIRFGKAYDNRNMPMLRCYQRERGRNPPYPWSVQMPAATQPVSIEITSVAIPA